MERTVVKAIETLSQLSNTYEVIVVNDGSSDHTLEKAEALVKKYSQVRVVSHEQNSGYGAALRTGFQQARYEVVCFTDADGQFDFSEVRKFLDLIENKDAVLGYRLRRQDKAHRKINTFIYKMVVDFLFGLRVKDIDCAFKMFRKKVFSRIAIEADGAVASAELLIKLKRNGFSYAEVGVNHYPRLAGNPTGAKVGVIIKAMKELLSLRKRLNG